MNLLKDLRVETFYVQLSKKNEYSRQDIISALLSLQLGKLKQILNENVIKVYSTIIQGDSLKNENIIKIKIEEDTIEPLYSGRGKNKQRLTFNVIMPNVQFVREKLDDFLIDFILNSKDFNDYIDAYLNGEQNCDPEYFIEKHLKRSD